MKSTTKKKRIKSISSIILIYLNELKNCNHSCKTPRFLDEILEKKNIFYDAPLLEELLSNLEKRDLIKRIDGVTYLKDDSINCPPKSFNIKDLSSFSKTIHLYEITGQGIILCNEKSKMKMKIILKIIQYMIEYFMFLKEVFDLVNGCLFTNFKSQRKQFFDLRNIYK